MIAFAQKSRVVRYVRQATATMPPPLLAGLPLLLGLLLAGLATLVRFNVPPTLVDFARPNMDQAGVHTAGFYNWEETPAGAYRWTSGSAMVQLPYAYHTASSFRASLRLRAENPNGAQPLTLLANERPLATVVPDTQFRVYHMVLPAPPNDTTLRLAIRTNTFTPEVNPRPLGVIVTGLAITPTATQNWWAVLVLALAPLFCTLLLRWRGASMAAALGVAALLGGALLGCYALYRAAPLPFPLLALLALAGCAVATVLASTVAARLSLALLALLMTFSGVFWPYWLSDDAFISYRYAQNLVAGHGLVYNVGERVEGYTNFLWTMLAAAVLALGIDMVWWSYVSGIVLALALLFGTYRLALRLVGPPWALVAALVVATSQSVLIHTARGAGLETGLFALLVLLGSAVYLSQNAEPQSSGDAEGEKDNHAQDAVDSNPPALPALPFVKLTNREAEGSVSKGQSPGPGLRSSVSGQPTSNLQSPISNLRLLVGLIFALATLTRPEGALLMGLTTIFDLRFLILDFLKRPTPAAFWRILVTRHSLLVTLLLPYLLIVIPFFLWRYSYYGDWLPNTFYAKTGGGWRQALRGLEYAGGFALALGGPLLLLSFVGLWRRGWAALWGWRGYMLLLVCSYTAYVIVVGGDHFYGERFFVALVPLFAILMADGLAHLLWRREPRTENREPRTENREPRTENQEPRTENQSSIVNRQSSIVNLQSPTLAGPQCSLGWGWWCIVVMHSLAPIRLASTSVG
jgi:hypothetical protein